MTKTQRWSLLLAFTYATAALTSAGGACAATVRVEPAQAARIAGCELHVVEDGGSEQMVPCAESILTANRRSVAWIETETSMTPFLTDVTGGAQLPISGLVPSGTIALDLGHELLPGERIRLISLTPPAVGTSLRPLFVRDTLSVPARLRMPAGRVIALLIDQKGRAVAASRPITVVSAQETVVWPASDRSGSTIAAWLKRPQPMEHEADDRLTIRAEDATGARAPDVLVNAADSLFAVWYGLASSSARIVVKSQKVRLARNRIDLSPGTVSLLEETLDRLPTLTVTIDPPPAEARIPTPLVLEVVAATEETTILWNRSVEPGHSYVIESLPIALLTLVLHIGDFSVEKPADLTSGNDARASITLEPLIVSGNVYFGETRARAVVRFQQRGTPILVETDYRGAYVVTLWQPRRYIVETTIADRPTMPPFLQQAVITSTDTFDIHVPSNAFSARIYDSADGKAVLAARVTVHNRWSDESGSHSAVTSVVTQGELTPLPPQRTGATDISVRAEGYAVAETETILVDEGSDGRVIDIPMKRIGEVAQLEIRLDGVAPAAGAEVTAWSGEQMTWHGTADDAGRIALPASLAGRQLLVRHPSAASEVILLPQNMPEQIISMSPAAPPLLVRVVRRNEDPIGPAAARVTLWYGGVRVSGPAAGFMTWSLGATRPDGVFVAKGLPTAPVRILATRSATAAQIASGSLDVLATTAPHPWPPVVTLTLADE